MTPGEYETRHVRRVLAVSLLTSALVWVVLIVVNKGWQTLGFGAAVFFGTAAWLTGTHVEQADD